MESPIENTGDKSREEIIATLKRIEEEEARLLGGWQTQLNLSVSTEAEEARLDPDTASLLDNVEDPALTKKLWWNAQILIVRNTVKGEARKFALAEKGIFLKASGETTDSKFTFKRAVQTVYDIVDAWIRSNGDPIELGIAFWDLNERNGFHAPKKQTSFDKQLEGLLAVPPPKQKEPLD